MMNRIDGDFCAKKLLYKRKNREWGHCGGKTLGKKKLIFVTKESIV